MRIALTVASLLSLGPVISACSSDSTGSTGGTQHERDASTGGSSSGAGGSATGGQANGTGGGTGTGGTASGTGGANPADCHTDAGTDECRLCLASHCCDDFTGCTNDATCRTRFDTYQSCVKASGGDANTISDCFSTFASGNGADYALLTTCDYNYCSVECGGPIPI